MSCETAIPATKRVERMTMVAERARGGVVIIDSLRCRFRRACLHGGWRHLAIGPDGAVLEVFLLPNRNSALEGVDGEAASFEGGRPVCRTDRDENAGLANFEPAKPMRNGDEVDGKFLAELDSNFSDFRKRHGFVSFIVQIERAPSTRMIAHATVEGDDGSVFICANVLDKCVLIDWVAHKKKKIGLYGFCHGHLR